MEMKSFNRAARRRGTTIAAAALSVALVAPFVHPVVAPQSSAEAQAQTSGTVAATPVTDPSKLIEADGIANGYVTKPIDMTNAFATLSGSVGLKETAASSSLDGSMGINDATVYMQFKDRDGTISPIYTTKSHQLGGDAGTYVFDLRAKDEDGNVLSHPDSPVPGGEYSFVDANGKPHIFRAVSGQEYRLWVDSPLKNEETGNDLGYVRQAGGGVPGAWVPALKGTANGAFFLRGNNMQRTGVFLEERAPSVSENSYMVSPEFSMDEEGWRKPGLGADVPRYSYFGRVWSDAEGGPDRDETGPLYEWDGDQPIEGAKVYASVLSDDGIAEYERLAIADKPYREQAAATKAMIENMRANGKEPILKTVGAVTDAEGRYTIRMGEDISDRIKNYTYIWAENDGKVLNSFSGFPTPVFQKVNGNAGENPNWGGDVGIPSHAYHRWYNINFAEVQADIANLDIVNYDSYLNPADLPEGINNLEPAKIKLTGALPFSGDNKIRWIGPDGKQVGEDCPVDTLADAANCSLAPEDFKNPGTYVAQLVNAYDVVVGQDSFIAIDKVRQNGEFEPQYEDATAPTGEKTTVEAPKDKDGKEIPEGTTFEPAGQVTDPDGNKIDKPEWIKVNQDGSIVVEPPKDAKPGDYTIPVVVTYPDGSRETIEAKVNVKTSTPAPSITAGSEKDEVPADGSEKSLDDKVENPTDGMTGEVLDKDGNPIEDATVEVDPGTGEITVTVPEGTDPQDGKVVVKDKNGDKVGEVDVEITEPKDKTPAPSITAGSETDEVPADGSEKTLDDKVKNPTEGMTGEVQDKDGNPIDGAKVEIDPKTGDVKVTVPKGTKPQDAKVVVKDKDGKPVGDPIDVKITEPKTDAPDTSNASVVPDTVTVVEGQEAKPFEVAKDIPEGGQVKAEGLPAGLTVNPSTGEVTGTPAKISDWGKDEEERDVEVTVSVTDKDGKEVAQDTKTVTVQRDTDGDGQPDVTDTDDDNDGATDAEEEKAGTDPKDDSSKPALTDEPSVVTDKVTVVDGQEADPFEVAKNIPEGGKVAAEGLPDGLSVDESTGEVTGTPSVSDWGKDEEERDVEVTVSVTDSDGKEVAQDTKTVTVQRDTDGDGQPDVTDTDDDNDGATDAEETEAGTDPKDANSKPEAKPGDDQGATSVDKSGVKDVKPSGEDQNTGIKVTNPDEGTKVSATDKNGKDVPAKIDDNGNVVVTPGEDVEGPITVVIEDEDLDGGKAEVEVGVKGEEPDNQGGSSDLTGGSSLPDLSSGSSNVDWKRCAPAAAGVGIPLLFLLPIGLASQMNIPGFSPLVKQVSAQIDGINRQLGAQNTALQKQLGIYNGPLAQQANQINLMLKKVSPEAGRIGGGIALAAAGALALGLVANACSPNGGSSSSSSSSK